MMHGAILRPGDSEGEFTFFKRKLSVCMDFSNIQGQVKIGEVTMFIKNVLRIPVDNIVDVQLHPVRKFVFIKVNNEDVCKRLEEKANHGVVWPTTATVITGWRCDSRSKEIRLFGVSPDKTEFDVKMVLSQFGEVKPGMERGRIPGLGPNVTDGTVRVRIDLGDNILPPYIKFPNEGEIWKIASNQIMDCC